MTAAPFQVFANGQGAVTAQWLDAVVLSTDLVADLYGFVGITGMQMWCRGLAAVNDGGGGAFYWASGQFTNNGTTVIVPTGSASGAWLRQGGGQITGVVVTSAATLTLASGLFYVYAGTSDANWTLPPLSQNPANSAIQFKNKSAYNLIFGCSGTDMLFAASAAATYSAIPGAAGIWKSDAINWDLT